MKEIRALQADPVIRRCVVAATILWGLLVFLLAYGIVFRGWLGMPNTISTIDKGVKELLELRAHRIFTVVPEKREVYVSTNPRLFQVEIPPNAVTETATFEFDQSPVVPLPASLGPGYEYLGWSVAFGPETLELMEPFTARVELTTEEKNLAGRLSLLHWSMDEMKWVETPSFIGQDLETGAYLLTFTTRDTGLFALSLKPMY